jgi:hypothetical protein
LFLEAQNKISASILPQLPLEIAVIKATNTFPQPTANSSQLIINKPVAETENIEFKNKKNKISNTDYDLQNNNDLTIDEVTAKWHTLLEKITPLNHSLKALLSNCRIFAISRNEITLATPYDFYMQKLNDQQNRLTVENVFSKIIGSKIHIKIIIDKEIGLTESIRKTSHNDKNGEQNSLLASAMEIIGGKVVEK